MKRLFVNLCMFKLFSHILLIVLLFPFFSEAQTDSTQQKTKESEFSWSYLLPKEVKYGGMWNKKSYKHAFYANYFVFGYTRGFSGDGLNSMGMIGLSYTYLDRKHFVSLYPYWGKVTWWGLNFGARVEPLLNVSCGRFSHTNVEISGGLLLNLSFSCLIPHTSSDDLFIGWKIGYTIAEPILSKEKGKLVTFY